MDHFKSLWVCYNVLLFYALVFWPQGMWDLSSLTRDRPAPPVLEDKVVGVFWLCWVFVAFAWAFSSCGQWRLLSVAVLGLLIAVASPCGAQAPEHTGAVVVVRGLSCSEAVESSQTREWTLVACTGSWIPIHCTTRTSRRQSLNHWTASEVPGSVYF